LIKLGIKDIRKEVINVIKQKKKENFDTFRQRKNKRADEKN
jgi:hypothetical protein